MFGLEVSLPAARRACCQRRLNARPPSMHASDDPIVEVPMLFSASGAFQRLASMCQQLSSIAAVCGYSSLSIMFLSKDAA